MNNAVSKSSGRNASWEQIKIWRQRMRENLIQQRIDMGGKHRLRLNELIEGLLVQQLDQFSHGTIGFYWPFKGEYDARKFVRYMLDIGWTAALPAVIARSRPLEFRTWTPQMKLVPGVWKIPMPEERQLVNPDVLLIPVVGFDDAMYRLGYGGGYYDRTIAALENKPFLIGIGYDDLGMETIYPQEHDIPMDIIITESGVWKIEDKSVDSLY